jgi:hypothetical protein
LLPPEEAGHQKPGAHGVAACRGGEPSNGSYFKRTYRILHNIIIISKIILELI